MRKWKPLIVVVIGLGIWGLSELFPAWEYLDGITSASRSAGYHFYKSPPPLRPPEEMKRLFNRSSDRLRIGSRRNADIPLSIDVHRDRFQTIAQRTVLLWLTFNGFVLSFGRVPSLLRVLLWIFFAFGVALALLLLWRVLL
jgi:hypothetical protein